MASKLFISLLRIQNPSDILEIGSAIGYSAIRMAEALPEASIVTIERDNERYLKAVDYIERSGLNERIAIIEADALLTEDRMIFDRTTMHFLSMLQKGNINVSLKNIAPSVASGGVIYCDNMFMHGMVLVEDHEVPRRKRTMIRNLKEFTRWVMTHPDYEYIFTTSRGWDINCSEKIRNEQSLKRYL